MAELRVLVADDDANMLDLMSRRLGRMGLQVDRAEDGRTALEMLKRAGYDLILTDIYMPGATGLDIIRLAKENDPQVQVVVVTGWATLDNAVEALNMGAFSYLTKPFDHLSVFDNAVSRALEFRRLIRDNLRMAEIQRRRGGLVGRRGHGARALAANSAAGAAGPAGLSPGWCRHPGGKRAQTAVGPAGLCGSVDGVRQWRGILRSGSSPVTTYTFGPDERLRLDIDQPTGPPNTVVYWDGTYSGSRVVVP